MDGFWVFRDRNTMVSDQIASNYLTWAERHRLNLTFLIENDF